MEELLFLAVAQCLAAAVVVVVAAVVVAVTVVECKQDVVAQSKEGGRAFRKG